MSDIFEGWDVLEVIKLPRSHWFMRTFYLPRMDVWESTHWRVKARHKATGEEYQVDVNDNFDGPPVQFIRTRLDEEHEWAHRRQVNTDLLKAATKVYVEISD